MARKALTFVGLSILSIVAISAFSISAVERGIEGECSPQRLTEIFSQGGSIGITTRYPGKEIAGRPIHMEIDSVSEGSPAAHAGLRKGDAILSIDGRQVLHNPEDAEFFGNFHRDLELGQKVVYVVLRDNKEVELEVVAGPRTEEATQFYVLTHLMFNDCEEYEDFAKSLEGKPGFSG